jgi:hypothetical protein
VTTSKTVRIERKAGSKLLTVTTLKLTKSGTFKWTKKPNKTGRWVFVAAYKVGAVTYLSKPVTVTVRN